MIDSRALFN